jgi:extracellular factor (EF) 3-hydroxypalmitic acid methyl ester biosynthesis protein
VNAEESDVAVGPGALRTDVEDAVKQAMALLEQFSDDDAEWLLQSADERGLVQDETLIHAGEPVETLHLIVQGLFGVFDERGSRLAILGPGDLMGELSFLEGRMPTESVRALEDSTVLVLARTSLRERAEREAAFAARLYRAFARVLAGRLRGANRRLSVVSETGVATSEDHPAWVRLAKPLEEFKQAMVAANDAAVANGDRVPDDMSNQIVEQFLEYAGLLNEVLERDADNDRVREEIGLRIQREMLPYLLLTATAERFYTKPRGYAGDFWSLELIYRNQPAGSTAIGEVFDRCFLELHAARSVRHRRGILAEHINKAVRTSQQRPAQVTSLACGPAREVFEAFAALEDPADLRATLLDIDLQALAFVSDEAKAAGIERQLSLVPGNLVRLALGKAHTDIRDQDLVYSIGLIDYLGDELVVRLMDLIHSMLRDGGRVVLGNVHTSNPTRAMMDHVLDWRLIHRTEDDMHRLFESSAFGRPATDIRFEDEKLNMFAECVR